MESIWSTSDPQNTVIDSTADISLLLKDLLPEESSSSADDSYMNYMPEDMLNTAASTTDGSSTASPPRNITDDRLVKSEGSCGPEIALDDLDMWDVLSALEAPLESLDQPSSAAAFARQTSCVSPTGWAAAAEKLLVPTTPVNGEKKKAAKAERRRATTKSAELKQEKKMEPSGRTTSRTGRQSHVDISLTMDDGAATEEPTLAPLSSGVLLDLADSGSESGDREGESSTLVGFDASTHIDSSCSGADDTSLEMSSTAVAETTEEKRLKRMRRNRESAAMSRNRKKQYVEELEAQVANLHKRVQLLQSENVVLRRECSIARHSPTPPSPQLTALGFTSTPPDEPATSSVIVPVVSPAPLFGADEISVDLESLPPLVSIPAEERHSSGVPSVSSSRPTNKRSASPLLGAASKRVSAASLALMSTVTLVALQMTSVRRESYAMYPEGDNVRIRSQPGMRMLMSIADDVVANPSAVESLLSTLRSVSSGGSGAAGGRSVEPLMWEADASADGSAARYDASPSAHQLPAPTPREWRERLVRAPPNSSWSDVLKIEEAERQLAQAQLALRALNPAHPAAAPIKEASLASTQLAPARYDALARHGWHDGALSGGRSYHHHDLSDLASAESERYIFCSRAYMFDAVPNPISQTTHNDNGHVDANSIESLGELPLAMPPRFRHSSLPQLTDGVVEQQNTSTRIDKSTAPLVTFLLPSAAIHGLSGVGLHGLDPGGVPYAGAPPSSSEDSLVQVQCQVVNASRWVPA